MALSESLVKELGTAADEVVNEGDGSSVASNDANKEGGGTDGIAGSGESSEGEAGEGESEESGAEGKETGVEETGEDNGVSSGEGESEGSEAGEETGEVGEEGEAAEGGEAAESTVSISDYALELAVRVGLPLDDARGFPSEDALLRVVSSMEEASQRQAGSTQQGDGKKGTEQSKKNPLEDFPELDPETHEPEIISAFDKLTKVVGDQQKELEAFREQQNESSRARVVENEREITSWFDTQVNNLGDDFSEALGKGDYESLSRGSSHRAKRDEIAEQLSIQLAGYEITGRKAPPRNELFNTAARLVLNEEFTRVSKSKLTSKLVDRSRKHISRASSKPGTKTVDPFTEAANILDEKFSKK